MHSFEITFFEEKGEPTRAVEPASFRLPAERLYHQTMPAHDDQTDTLFPRLVLSGRVTLLTLPVAKIRLITSPETTWLLDVKQSWQQQMLCVFFPQVSFVHPETKL